MKNVALLLLGPLLAACAADPTPPAASSATVDAATDNRSTNTAPAQTDMAQAAKTDRLTTAERPEGNGSSFAIPGPSPSPDNDESALASAEQGGSVSDRKLTQDIRHAVMSDSSLSPGAKNVKITTNSGKVTLRGAVKTERERAAIEAAAKKIAGANQVSNLLEIAN